MAEKRYVVELEEEMGKSLQELADKMSLSLTAIVRMMLYEPWSKYKHYGAESVSLKFE